MGPQDEWLHALRPGKASGRPPPRPHRPCHPEGPCPCAPGAADAPTPAGPSLLPRPARAHRCHLHGAPALRVRRPGVGGQGDSRWAGLPPSLSSMTQAGPRLLLCVRKRNPVWNNGTKKPKPGLLPGAPAGSRRLRACPPGRQNSRPPGSRVALSPSRGLGFGGSAGRRLEGPVCPRTGWGEAARLSSSVPPSVPALGRPPCGPCPPRPGRPLGPRGAVAGSPCPLGRPRR